MGKGNYQFVSTFQYLKITEIGSLLMIDGSIGLRGLAYRTFCVFLEPFEDALFVVDVLAFQLNDLLVGLELAITDSAKVLFLLFDVIIRFVTDPLDFFELLFG